MSRTNPNAPYPSYWVQNIFVVVDNSVHGWIVAPLFEILKVDSSGNTTCVIDTNFTKFTGRCQLDRNVTYAYLKYLLGAIWSPIVNDGALVPLGLQSTIFENGNGQDVVGLTTLVNQAPIESFVSNLILPAGSFVSEGQGEYLLAPFYEPQLAFVSLPDGIAVFEAGTAGTVSSQAQLGQSWLSTPQAPFTKKDSNGNDCSSTNESSSGLM